MQSLCLHPFSCNKFSFPTKPPTFNTSPAPFSIPVKSSMTSSSAVGDVIPVLLTLKQKILNRPLFMQSLVAAIPPIAIAKNLGFRPTREFGLLSHLFVLSMACMAFFSVAVVSIPTIIAFGWLGASAKKLSKVVSEELPGTLSSLKLSSMELNNLTQQLSSLRHKITGLRIEKKDGNATSSRSFSKNQTS